MIIFRVTVYDPHLFKNIIVEGRGETEEEADRQIEAVLKEHNIVLVPAEGMQNNVMFT